MYVVYFQATGMFLGEFTCLVVFYMKWWTYKWRGIPLDVGPQNFNPAIFWPASLCDMLATSLMYVGLNLTFASSFQMLRGTSGCILCLVM